VVAVSTAGTVVEIVVVLLCIVSVPLTVDVDSVFFSMHAVALMRTTAANIVVIVFVFVVFMVNLLSRWQRKNSAIEPPSQSKHRRSSVTP